MPVRPGERCVARFDDAQIILREDGGLYLRVHNRLKLTQASHRFSPSQAIALRDFLLSPDTDWTPVDTASWSGCATIAYSYETGLLTVSSHLGDLTLDPDKEEAFSKLVRRLKSLAPIPRLEHPDSQPSLPLPTPAQLASRTIFKKAMPAKGYEGQGGQRSGGRPASPSYVNSKAKLAALMAKFKPNLESAS